MPTGAEPLAYMVRTKSPLSDYTLIGKHPSPPKLSETGSLEVLPSFIFYAQRESPSSIAGSPSAAVVARQYTRGLVLYRTDLFGGDASWMSSGSKISVHLNGTFRQVLMTMNNSLGIGQASLGPPVTSIEMGPYQGAILQSVTAPSLSPTSGVAAPATIKVSGIKILATSPPSEAHIVTLRSAFSGQLGVSENQITNLVVTSSKTSRRRLLGYSWDVSFLVESTVRVAPSSWAETLTDQIQQDSFASDLANSLGDGFIVSFDSIGVENVTETPTPSMSPTSAQNGNGALETTAAASAKDDRGLFGVAGPVVAIIFASIALLMFIIGRRISLGKQVYCTKDTEMGAVENFSDGDVEALETLGRVELAHAAKADSRPPPLNWGVLGSWGPGVL
eukprot:CAMPEP_0172633600 /NCGR_PEP_ID=MMETSP1068-20121228/190234_1 /TAXON_ID=35684 /ORGANISM="Pseudopedinella elastica, Strain CCMP716" /LENGTH=390 /DNA_ID=CAMNT_0013445339 /DNA_START=13 /DNA_END=1183 /DNA_ORIENTATION=-